MLMLFEYTLLYRLIASSYDIFFIESKLNIIAGSVII